MCYDRNGGRTSHETRDRQAKVLVAQVRTAAMLATELDGQVAVADGYVSDALAKVKGSDLGSLNTMKVYKNIATYYGSVGERVTEAAAALVAGLEALKGAVPAPVTRTAVTEVDDDADTDEDDGDEDEDDEDEDVEDEDEDEDDDEDASDSESDQNG